jgi:hypothetical protein
VAKKVRGKSSTYRPGGQGPSRSKESTSLSNGDSSDAIDSAIDSAAEPVEVDVSEISIASPEKVARKPKAARRSSRAMAESLEGRAAAEQVWVRDDLRHIGIISAVLFTGLAIAWVLFVPLNLLGLY